MFPHATCMCTGNASRQSASSPEPGEERGVAKGVNDRQRRKAKSLWVIRYPKNLGDDADEIYGGSRPNGSQEDCARTTVVRTTCRFGPIEKQTTVTVASSKGKRDTKHYEESASDPSCVLAAKETVVAVSGHTVISGSSGAAGATDASDPDGSSITRKCCIGGSAEGGGGGTGRGNGNKGGGGRFRASGGYSLCHRLTTHSSTISDIQQSTSATAETIATSSGLIVSSRQGSVDGAMQRCGLCSIFSRLLRRAMCVGSRRGSGESYYQELADTAGSPPSPKSASFKHVPDVATMETTDSSIYIRLIPASNQQEQQRRQSPTDRENCLRRRVSDTDQDRPLLEALLYDDKIDGTRRRHVCNGRFLTMHKRRRKKLTTRSLVQDSAILDDVLHGQVQCILNQVGNWRFNAFTLETVTGGRSLPVLCVHLFHWYGLLDHFNLDVVRLWKLFTLIEEGYHSTNPYHNSIHATDVTQAMHCYLQERKIFENLTPVEIMASLIGAVTHDLDHPGVNQPFLIATSNHLAALYENTSVLENHHWRSAVGCLLESGVAEQIKDIRPELEKQIASLILATDITRQNEFLIKFREYIEQGSLDMTKSDNRHFILQIALKCADISNPCRPWDISKKWSQKVCEEFFRQGDYERQLNLPVTSLCDRFSMSVPKIQVGFFKYVVTPLFVEWHRFLNTSLSTKMMEHLKSNQEQWESKVAAELAEETKTEISDAEIFEEDIDDEEGEGNVDISDSSEVLLPEIKLPRRSSLQVPVFGTSRFDRRHSVPVNPPRIILPPRDNVSRSAIREDMESKLEDSFSLLSSDSDSGPRKSSAGSVADCDRPLSAETLVPELNIATMSNSECADRLNLVMHGSNLGFSSANTLSACNASKQLIRQQTFPPLQPYIRTRYMSAAAEMSSCSEALEKRSSSSESPSDPDRDRGILTSSSSSSSKRDKRDGGCSGKREQDNLQSAAEKSCKMVKLSIPEQKENMDPTMLKKGLTRRRGSAPVAVALPPKTSAEESVSLLIRTCDTFMRRGSMPADVIYKPSNEKQFETFLLAAQNLTPFQRRGSVPCDNKSSNRSTNNNCNGKARNRKKLLRRRSSGGAEILTPILAEAELAAGSSSGASSSSAWYRFKRTDRSKSDIESLLSRRRGSLPVEVLAVCHTGTLRH